MKSDSYNTIAQASPEILFKEKKSKFFGYAFPIKNEEEVKPIIDTLRKQHHTANHVCYAWQLGTDTLQYRANDDGEPNNSAGMPIYGQIQSFEVTNVLVAVARIFGGVKLGIGGLISAYRTSAKMALESSSIIEKIVSRYLKLSFTYQEMDRVMRTIKRQRLEIVSQKMEMECTLIISVPRNDFIRVKELFQEMNGIQIKKCE